MFSKYLHKLVFKVKEISDEYDQVVQETKDSMVKPVQISPTQTLDNSELKKNLASLQSQLNLLRRDVNDLHTILMLRSASANIPKKKRIAFIGTGQINENVVHAYIYFQKAIQEKLIDFDGEAFFVARTEIEYELLSKYGYPCIIWKYQPELALKLLETKVVVLSSHLYSFWGDCLLTHCVADTIKIELWHGLPAKNIALSCINNGLEFHFFSRLLEDSVATKHVCIQTSTDDVIEEYARAFPYAKQHTTGDCRTDILFNEKYRQEFLVNKSDKKIQKWLSNNKDNIKILYAPTYRESKTSHSEFYKKLLELLSVFDGYNVKLAIKLHVGIVLTKLQIKEIEELCNSKGHLFVAHIDEMYSTFNDFDTIIVDYSSIRSDFALTGKPVFLWQFDKAIYKRPTDVVKVFSELDNVSYNLDENIVPQDFINTLQTDPLKEKRQKLVNNKLKTFSDGNAAKRTIDVILDVVNG